MLVILKKELNQFFSSLVGYIAIVVFLVFTALFTFMFPDTSMLDAGFANLDTYFIYAPFLFLFLVPAITMRLFSEEFNKGTIELLATRPLTDNQIVVGKYSAAFALIIFSIIPTLLYFFTAYKLASPVGNVDTGGIIGSYFGLLLLGSAFVAIGIFSSAITSNQILAFLTAVSLCFFLYIGLDLVAKLPIFMGTSDYFVEQIGMNAHYLSMSRGVIDTRDVLYFVSVTILFIVLTKLVLKAKK